MAAADCDHRQNPRAFQDQDSTRLGFQYYQPLISTSDYVGADLEVMLMPDKQLRDQEESSRGKLLKHWNDVAGRFCIPEKWGQEEALMKDYWRDCSLFDALLAPKGVVSAREALVAEQKRGRTRQLIKDGVYVS